MNGSETKGKIIKTNDAKYVPRKLIAVQGLFNREPCLLEAARFQIRNCRMLEKGMLVWEYASTCEPLFRINFNAIR